MARHFTHSFVRNVRIAILGVALFLLLLHGVDLLLDPKQGLWPVKGWWPLREVFAYQRTEYLAFGVLCTLLPLVYALAAFLEIKFEAAIRGRGADGQRIVLSPEAVERAVTRDVRANVEEVVRVLDCSAVQGPDTARVTIKVALSDKTPVPNVQRKIRATAKQTLTKIIGYGEEVQVEVVVRDVQGAALPRKQGIVKARPAGKRIRLRDTAPPA